MTWTVIGTPGTKTTWDNTSTTVTLPSGYDTGDLLLLFLRGFSDTQYITAEPSGYTLLYSTTGTASSSYWAVYGKIAASAAESTPSVTFGGTSAKAFISCAVRDSNGVMTLASIVGDPDKARNSGFIDYPACTVAEDNSILFLWGSTGKNNDTGNYSAQVPSTGSFTELVESELVDAYGVFAVVDYWIQTTATNLTAGSWTIDGDTAQNERLGVVFYLKSSSLTVTPTMGRCIYILP
jgi:hypothetical protein